MERTTGSLSRLTTQSLLGHARAGNNSAWKVLLMRYRMTLVVAASRHLGSPADVEDVVQQAFMNAITAIESFEYANEGSFRRYLVKVVTNRCHDIYRSRRPYKAADLSSIPHPASTKEASPLEQDLVQALEKLPEELREVVLLRKYESKPWEEVAEILEESSSSSRRKYVRAIGALREMLE